MTEHLERQVPTVPGTLVGIFKNHIERYRFANSLLSGGTVVDVGCGVGYGSLILDRASAYVGIDRDASALEYAETHFAAPTRSWQRTDVGIDEFGERQAVDAVLLMEIIEHVPRDRWFHVMRQCRAMLAVGGLLVLTSPVGHVGIHRPTPYHEYEPTQDELIGVLEWACQPTSLRYQRNGEAEIVSARPAAERWEVIITGRGYR